MIVTTVEDDEHQEVIPVHKGRTFVMADIHGAYKALRQCLERSGFDKSKDTLIQLGDVVDGWGQTYECVEELLSIPNLIAIRGNHDQWFNEWNIYGTHPVGWMHGGEATLMSYIEHADREINVLHRMGGITSDLTFADVDPKHLAFFKNQHNYYIDDEKRCFVHGGFNRHLAFKEQPPHIYYWDRDLWYAAMSFGAIENALEKDSNSKFKMVEKFKEVFIGHTATVNWNTNEEEVEKEGIVVEYRKYLKHPITTPMHAANIWNLDTGAGFFGKLTIMEVDTHEYWQSDLCSTLYPEERGRK